MLNTQNQTTTLNYKESNEWKSWNPKRGEVYLIDLGDEGMDSEQMGLRPCVILSNNRGNTYGSIIQVAPITSQKKNKLPIHVTLDQRDGLKVRSLVCIEQAKCISKRRAFINNSFILITQLSQMKMKEIDNAIKIQFALN